MKSDRFVDIVFPTSNLNHFSQFSTASNLLQKDNDALQTRLRNVERQINNLERWECLSLTELQLEIARWIQEKRIQSFKTKQNAHSATKPR